MNLHLWWVRLAALSLGFLAFVFSSPLCAQPNGLSLVRNFYQPHGQSGDTPPVRFNGCWGYVAPDGREYALLGTYTGTAIIDITDSANVREIVHIAGPSSIWREIRTWGSYAYVVTEAGQGTQVLDLSGLPDTAWRVTSFTYTSGSNNTSRAHTVEIADGYMYLNGCANWSPGGIVIFNLNSTPTQPQFEGVYNQRYIHDCHVRNDTVFAAAINLGGGIDIIDVRTKSAPALITRITYTSSGTHNTWTTKDRRYVLSTDEIRHPNKNLKIWDLATLPLPPASPASEYSFSPPDIVHNVTVRGNYAYVAWYTAGTVVVDISNPLAPQTSGWHDSYPGASGSYNGVWGVYPYFPSGKIISSDMQTGLYIYRFANLPPRRPVRLIQPSDRDTVRSSGPEMFRWTSAADREQDPHFSELKIAGPGVDIATRVADTVHALPSLNDFQPGETYQWHVLTRDGVTAVASVDTFRFVYLPPPSTPVLSSPPNHAPEQPVFLTFAWQAPPGAAWYRLQVSSDSLFAGVVVDSTLSGTEMQAGPLAGNTRYFWRVRAGNSSGTSTYSSPWDFTTMAPPLAPTLISPAHGTHGHPATVSLRWQRSPNAEQYHLQVATDSLFLNIVQDIPAIPDTSYGLTSLSNVTAYYWHVLASNAGGSSPWSEAWRFMTGYALLAQYDVTDGWNMISLPLDVSDPRKDSLYPTSTSGAFTFLPGSGYVARDTIENGRGYWLKFDTAQTVAMTGVPRVVDSIAVTTGWNMIGTIAEPVPTGRIVEIPPGIIHSPYFQFDGRYVPSDTLSPGRSYWVKVGQTGRLVLTRETP